MAPHTPPYPEWRPKADQQLRNCISGQEHLLSIDQRKVHFAIAESIRTADHDKLQFAFSVTVVPTANLHLKSWQGLARYASRVLTLDFEAFESVEKIVQDACKALNTTAVDKAAHHPDLRRMGEVAQTGTDGLSAVECCIRINDAVKASALARRFYAELLSEIKDAKRILETGYKGQVPDLDLEDSEQEEDEYVAPEDAEGRTEVEGDDVGQGVKQQEDANFGM